MENSFDAIVIGTGQSGPSLAARFAKEGKRVAIAERGRFGGTCVNTGCTPTKAMVASARVAYLARRAADFGVEISGVIRVDMKRVKARKDEIVSQSSEGVEKMLKTSANITVFQSHATFVSNHELTVGDETITAPQIFINTGARSAEPQIPGIKKFHYLTSSSILDLEIIPEHLIIVGGSYIGLEFGQMFRRFGSQVTMLERGSRLMGKEDPDISDSILKIFEGEGITVHLDAKGLELSQTSKGIQARLASGATVTGSHLLLATGRKPNTDDLGLEHTDIATDEQGYIQVDEELRTSSDGVWAIGDCNGRGAFTHTSYNDYEIVAANLFDGGTRRLGNRIPAYNVYIDPPLGRIGLTETEVRKSGRKALIARMEMSKVSRAKEKGETQGLMKVIVDAETSQILGAAILGTGGDEAIHCILDVMYAKAPCTVIQRAVHIHPTVSELIPTMLGNLEPLTEKENQ